MIYASSSVAYATLRDENILCLPSISTLKKVTRRLNVNNGLNNASYLKLRIDKINEFQRNVVLMIDEVYVAKRVEYTGGVIQGLTLDGSVASTLLCFMIKSVVGKYKDHCKESLVTENKLEPIDIDNKLNYSAATFMESINRGG